ncbi:hypothetical protein EMCG_01358 [[Emmonsia] crescens]|uniref:Uncharacterized protein n=1 Tax=[Emmonsia] crescens TaxID=73230 RepID=A0A0G2I384_9EURO|nr:hypothetical protein EMCG_01358 [Emmonsia crescens UAMH 3008]
MASDTDSMPPPPTSGSPYRKTKRGHGINLMCLLCLVAKTLLRSQGLLDYDLVSTANVIHLCPNCHVNFNHSSNPGFVFIPSDLGYFIRFEEDDYGKHKHEAAWKPHGLDLPRDLSH